MFLIPYFIALSEEDIQFPHDSDCSTLPPINLMKDILYATSEWTFHDQLRKPGRHETTI